MNASTCSLLVLLSRNAVFEIALRILGEDFLTSVR